MKENGVDNPAFEPPSPEEQRAVPGLRGRRVSPASPGPSPNSEELCGWGRFAPPVLQLCNNAEGYLVFYSLLSVFQGIIVNGLINVSISTIEKRYELNSSLTGLISASYDIAFCVLCLFISFYGERGHKPRWLAVASFLIGLGSLVFSLPHFASGVYKYGEKLDDTCPVTNNQFYNASCTPGSKSSLSNYLYVFILGQLILGAGGTPLYTLGTAFIDDSVPKHKASVYIGIGYSMSLLGPAIGYILGGQLLKIYVDFNHQVRTDITPDDPRWVGAWWVAFVACSFCTWLLVAPFSYFPRRLPGTQKIQAEKISEAHHGGKEHADIGKSIRDFPRTLWNSLKKKKLKRNCPHKFHSTHAKNVLFPFRWFDVIQILLVIGLVTVFATSCLRVVVLVVVVLVKSCLLYLPTNLLKNPVLMCLVIAAAVEALVATGFATFLPKFIENQFGFSSSYSATLGGVVLIPGAALGQIISGTLVSKLKLDCKNVIKFIVITCSIALALNSVFLFAKCGNEPFAGVSETYNGTGMLFNLTAPCNENCHCLRSVYLPVCGTDDVQYFSPCYAGCNSVSDQESGKVYNYCSCIVNHKRTVNNITHGAVTGKCASKCTVLPAFLFFFFLTVIFTFMAVTPTTVAILRCVPDTHRSFAMGVHMLFLRIVGTIPGPILFGVAIDNSCTLWSIDNCGKTGACWVYNNHLMAYTLMGISATCKVISIAFTVIAFFLYKPPPAQTSSSQKNIETETSVQL